VQKMAEQTNSTARIEPALSFRERDSQPSPGMRGQKARQKPKAPRPPVEQPETIDADSAADEQEKHELDTMA